MRQSEPALHEPDEPEVVIGVVDPVVVAVATTVSKLRSPNLRPAAVAAVAKVAR
jgi:hypothetical protein